jgi:predicted transcriptional regulator
MSEIKADVWWSKIFRSLIDNGDLAKMSGSAVKAYFALKSRVNAKTGLTSCSMQRIALDTGISEKSARRAIAELVEHGYVHQNLRPGRTSELQLIEKFTLRNGEHIIGRASFAYIPKQLDQRLRELKQILSSPTPQGSETINVELDMTNNLTTSSETMDIINLDPYVSVSTALEMTKEIIGGKTLQRHLERISIHEFSKEYTHTLDNSDRGYD